MFDKSCNKAVYKYLMNRLRDDGVLHFSVIDPDPHKQSPDRAASMACLCEAAGSDAILVGGSTVTDQEFVSSTVEKIKAKTTLPVIIFPGGIPSISSKADAIFFMSMLNSRDPYFIVGQQALVSYPLKSSGLETISLAYLIIEPGATAGWVGNAKPLPRNDPKLTAAYALTAEMYGFQMLYLEAGSGANTIPASHVSYASEVLSIPIIAGGGINTKEDARLLVEAGADVIVMGTFIEKHVLKDEGESLKPIIREIKSAGSNKNPDHKYQVMSKQHMQG